MIQIVFPGSPEQRARRKGWWVGLQNFATKRAASIYLADSGRKATAWLMELNELHRMVIHAGQSYAATMELWQLMKWAQSKASYDARYIMVRRTAKSVTTSEMYPRIQGLTTTLIDMASILIEIGSPGDKATARIIQERATMIVKEMTGWQKQA